MAGDGINGAAAPCHEFQHKQYFCFGFEFHANAVKNPPSFPSPSGCCTSASRRSIVVLTAMLEMGVVCAEFYPYQGQRFHPAIDSWSGSLTLAVGPDLGVSMRYLELWNEFKCPRVVLLSKRTFGNAWNRDVCVAEIFMMVIKQSSWKSNFLHRTGLIGRTKKKAIIVIIFLF